MSNYKKWERSLALIKLMFLWGPLNKTMVGCLGFYDSTHNEDDSTVGAGLSRKYCNTGMTMSQTETNFAQVHIPEWIEPGGRCNTRFNQSRTETSVTQTNLPRVLPESSKEGL